MPNIKNKPIDNIILLKEYKDILLKNLNRLDNYNKNINKIIENNKKLLININILKNIKYVILKKGNINKKIFLILNILKNKKENENIIIRFKEILYKYKYYIFVDDNKIAVNNIINAYKFTIFSNYIYNN